MTREKTSPPTPQPKQWKSCFSSSTVNEGVFSEWKGQSPTCFRPLRLRVVYWEAISTMDAACRTWSIISIFYYS